MDLQVLLTSTSFMDTPGKHQELLARLPLNIHTKRGPLNEAEMLDCIAHYDALLCGDDALTAAVLQKGHAARLRFVSKYGVGLDKIDLQAARDLGIPVTNCPGVNQVSVAEHFFALLLAYLRNIHTEHNEVQGHGRWTRLTGHEMFGKNLLILGLGRIGTEIARRALAFGLQVYTFDQVEITDQNLKQQIQPVHDLEAALPDMHFISLNLPLLPTTKHMLNAERLQRLRKDAVIVNTARGELVDRDALLQALKQQRIGGYLTDVLDVEPMPETHPLRHLKNVLITPHIGSRTFDSVERQGLMAVENLMKGLNLEV